MIDVPTNAGAWPVALLGQVAYAQAGRSPRKRDYAEHGPVRIIRFRDIDCGAITWSPEGPARARGFVKPDAGKGLRDLCAGDTLISAAAHAASQIGKKLAYVDHIPNTYERVCYVAELLALRPRDPAVLDPRWLFYFLQSEPGQEEIARAARGGHLLPDAASRMRIALPPPAWQKRMIHTLGAVDRCAAATRAVVKQLDTVRDALLHELIAVPGAQTWPAMRLGACIRGIDSGWSPRCEPGPALPAAWGVLKASSVSSGIYLPNQNKQLPANLAPRPDIEVKPGDVLVTRASGARARVGVAAFVANTRPRLMLSDKTLRIRPGPGLDAHFLSLAFGSAPVRTQILGAMTGSQMYNISQRALVQVMIPMPGLDQQRTIARVFADVARRRDVESASQAELQTLGRALLARFLPKEPTRTWHSADNRS